MLRTPESRSIPQPHELGAPRRMNCKCGQIASECDCREHSDTEEEDNIQAISVSPQPQPANQVPPWQSVRRRIDFSVSPPSSPRRIELPSISAEVSLESNPPSNVDEPTLGECTVCYCDLPARSNHVATVCGHLFCVKCLLKWHLTSTTCPMCRIKLYDDIDTYEFEPDSEIVESWGSLEPINVENENENEINVENEMNAYLREQYQWTGNVNLDDRLMGYSPDILDNIQDMRSQVLLDLITPDETDSFQHMLIQPQNYLDIATGPERCFEFVMKNGTHYFGALTNIRIVEVPSSEYCFEMMNTSMIACFYQEGRAEQIVRTPDSHLLLFNQIQRVYLIQVIINVD